MAAELAKHLNPIKEGLKDLTRCTPAMQDKMEDIPATTSSHDKAIQDLQEQIRSLEEAQEDLNSRSHRNNIRITADMLNSALQETFCGLLPEAPPAELLLDHAHKALRHHRQ
ncbi:Hypothetical predicted protein [Pelobates cultripes]|uniref:Uncharacterized protein n=1 Tax=Pelobates cultripes TaxID=61616 RepID=A0AAD1W3L8_PELCU|nr:Hypothetical predicted protein [Pelobates cultripes]